MRITETAVWNLKVYLSCKLLQCSHYLTWLKTVVALTCVRSQLTFTAKELTHWTTQSSKDLSPWTLQFITYHYFTLNVQHITPPSGKDIYLFTLLLLFSSKIIEHQSLSCTRGQTKSAEDSDHILNFIRTWHSANRTLQNGTVYAHTSILSSDMNNWSVIQTVLLRREKKAFCMIQKRNLCEQEYH